MTIGRWLAGLAVVVSVAVVIFATRPDNPVASGTSTTAAGVETPTTDEAIVPDPSLESVPGRLLVIRDSGQILTMRPDGSDLLTIADADDSVAERSLPAWSSNGDRIAWGERYENGQIDLVIVSASGDILSRVPIGFVPGYISWAPNDELIAFNGDDGEANQVLEVIDVAAEARSFLTEGAPIYYDWHPDGRELLVNSAGGLEFIAADGSARRAVATDGDFRVPVQTDGSLVVGFGHTVGHVLSVASPEGSVELEMIRYATPMAFTVGESGRLVLLSKGSAENQQLTAEEETDLRILEPNSFVAIDLESGAAEVVDEGRGVAWFFSRDGEHLAYVTEETVGEIQRLQWHLWDGSEIVDLAVFSPSGRFGRDHLAFFDQFERTTSLWSPDGSAFAFAGGDTIEDLGIWVQRVDADAPIRVAEGEAVFWSPGA